ncbi:hypothetical protein [Gracilinema caldarium]|nr:hypothetical protein [Gracilinema caldarium]
MKRSVVIFTFIIWAVGLLPAQNVSIPPKQPNISGAAQNEKKRAAATPAATPAAASPVAAATPAAAVTAEAQPIPFLYLWNKVQGWNVGQEERTGFFLFEPALLPPDLLAIPEEKNLSVAVAYENNRFELAFDASGKLALVPIPWAGVYTTVVIRRNAATLPINMELRDEKTRISVLEYEDDRPLRFQYEREGERYFGVLRYWGSAVDESWYSETGELKTLYQYTWSDSRPVQLENIASDGSSISLLRWEYNAYNHIAVMSDEKVQTSFFYDGKNRLVRVIRSGIISDEPDGSDYDRNFQYDELGRLVRQYGRNEEGLFEYRYQYSFDSQGRWIFCRVQAWFEQFGRLVPGSESIITRTFSRR